MINNVLEAFTFTAWERHTLSLNKLRPLYYRQNRRWLQAGIHPETSTGNGVQPTTTRSVRIDLLQVWQE